MLSEDISNKVLTVGCAYKYPKGGVAQVISNYSHYVFPVFKCVVNSGGNNKFYKLIRAIIALFQICLKLTFDQKIKIIHIHTASYNSFKRSAWFVYIGRLFRKKIVLHIHGGGFKEYYYTNPKWITSVLDKCDAIVVLSKSWKSFFEKISICSNIFIVENIIEHPVHTFVRDWQKKKINMLFLGLISEAKGIFDLLNVLSENAKMFHDKILLHIGGNGKVQELNEYVERYGLKDMVVYEGWVSGEKKVNLFQQADIFVLPSYTEGLPVSILEAMSYRLPILSTPVGGIPEVVKEGVNGILIQPGDTDALYHALLRLISDIELRENMGMESYRKVQSYFPEEVNRSLEKLYTYLLLD